MVAILVSASSFSEDLDDQSTVTPQVHNLRTAVKFRGCNRLGVQFTSKRQIFVPKNLTQK